MKDTDSEQPWKDFLTWVTMTGWECVELRQMVLCSLQEPHEQSPVLCLCLIDPGMDWLWLILSCLSPGDADWRVTVTVLSLLHSLKSNSFMRYNFLRLFIDLFGYLGLSWDMQDFSCDILDLLLRCTDPICSTWAPERAGSMQLCHGDTIFNLFLLITAHLHNHPECLLYFFFISRVLSGASTQKNLFTYMLGERCV